MKAVHPIGQAIYSSILHSDSFTLTEPDTFTAVPGKSIISKISDKQVLIGSESFLQENGIEIKFADNITSALRNEGKTAVLISIDDEPCAVMALTDKVRENAPDVVRELGNLGINVIMLTGDSHKTAENVACKLGIENVFTEVLPENKATLIASLKKSGKIVAMVGDGINDAPALATSDVGFSIHSGTDVAIETANIVLINNNLMSIPEAIKLSKKTIDKIRQNLFWAFIYNAIGIPFAAAGNLNPVVASAAMALSSVSVVMNSLLLYRPAKSAGKPPVL